jgi:hypothetical protein
MVFLNNTLGLNNFGTMPAMGMRPAPMANAGISSIFPTPQAPVGMNASTASGGLTGADMQIINQAALLVSKQMGIAPNAVMSILTFRLSALKTKGGNTESKFEAAGITDKNMAKAVDLAAFAESYLRTNNGQIPQNQQQYIMGVQNVAAADCAMNGKPPLIPMSAFGDKSAASYMLFARANKNINDIGYKA